jgi:hypothetical protein
MLSSTCQFREVPIADMIKEAERRPRWLLVIELFESDYASLWIGVKVHLLAVLDAFAFPSTVIGVEFGNLRIARLQRLEGLPLMRD